MATALITLVSLVSFGTAAVAQTAAQPPAQTRVPSGPVTFGPGHKLCSDWSAAETKADQSEYMANRFFVAGVMSAYNIFVSPPAFDIGHGSTPEDMKSFMHARCAAHPTETIATAATAFIAMLKARQTR